MAKVLVFGSLNLDRVYKVQEIVKEGETVSALSLEIFPGGKGLNQAVALVRAGATVYLAGGIGTDGTLLRETLVAAGVKLDYLETREGISGHAIIQVDARGQNCILIHPGTNHGNQTAYIDRVLVNFAPGDLLVLQNEIDGNAEIMKRAKAQGLQIALNPSPMDKAILDLPMDLVDCLLVNEHEAAALLGDPSPSSNVQEEDVVAILQALGARYPGTILVLTLGARGAVCRTPDGKIYRQAAVPTKVVDTTGAGDTFTGYFLKAIQAGQPVPDALQLTATAAAIAVSRKGAAPSIPSLDDVLKADRL